MINLTPEYDETIFARFAEGDAFLSAMVGRYAGRMDSLYRSHVANDRQMMEAYAAFVYGWNLGR